MATSLVDRKTILPYRARPSFRLDAKSYPAGICLGRTALGFETWETKVELCGVRTQNCPPGFKTGEQISPPGVYVGGGLQMQTDLAIDPAGNVWVMNNWQDIDSCFGTPEPLSTRCGGQGITIFYGMAKPVRAPQIGPARSP
jgi:hypothetical protein